uniref:Uncharacterized protein n=1 Tax=Ditylenchus dipsaci TaxID=166011 RepID=A0A915DER9_9BILA
MSEDLNNYLAEAIKKFQDSNPNLGVARESILKVMKTTRFSSQMISKAEVALSKVWFSNSSLDSVPLESKVEVKQDRTWGTVRAIAEKDEKAVAGEGALKLGVSKIWSILVADVNGKISCQKIDGTQLQLLGSTRTLKASTLMKNPISIGVIMESLANSDLLKVGGYREGFGYVITEKHSIYKGTYVEFFFNQYLIEEEKHELRTENAELKLQNVDLINRVRELETVFYCNCLRKLTDFY